MSRAVLALNQSKASYDLLHVKHILVSNPILSHINQKKYSEIFPEGLNPVLSKKIFFILRNLTYILSGG